MSCYTKQDVFLDLGKLNIHVVPIVSHLKKQKFNYLALAQSCKIFGHRLKYTFRIIWLSVTSRHRMSFLVLCEKLKISINLSLIWCTEINHKSINKKISYLGRSNISGGGGIMHEGRDKFLLLFSIFYFLLSPTLFCF